MATQVQPNPHTHADVKVEEQPALDRRLRLIPDRIDSELSINTDASLRS